MRRWLARSCVTSAGFLLVMAAGFVGAQRAATQDKSAPVDDAALSGRLYVRGLLIEKGQANAASHISVSIDPMTGAWEPLKNWPDGAFVVSRDGRTTIHSHKDALWKRDAKGGLIRIFDQGGAPVLSPDRRTLLLSARAVDPQTLEAAEPIVWEIDLTNDDFPAMPWINRNGETVLDWSADGNWLLMEREQAHTVVNRKTGQRLGLAQSEGGLNPQFFPDGRRVLYCRSLEHEIRSVNIDGTDDKLIFKSQRSTHATLGRLSPDGRHFAIILEDLTPNPNGQLVFAGFNAPPPRVAIVEVSTGKDRVLQLPNQGRRQVYPLYDLTWR